MDIDIGDGTGIALDVVQGFVGVIFHPVREIKAARYQNGNDHKSAGDEYFPDGVMVFPRL